MRRLLRIVLLVLLVPVLYVASAVVYFPAVVWHRGHAPAESALMRIRADQARTAGKPWNPRYAWVPLDRISPSLQHAVLAAEDTRFYRHHGFDWEQIQNAWEINRRAGHTVRGASTITQQTVKNLYLTPERSVLRKGREALLTAWMELWLPKDRILELYLNVVELGPGIYGAQAASEAYFHEPASALSRSQAALLAATLPAPLSRNPAAPSPGLYHRQRLVLSRMSRWYEGPSVAEQEAAAVATADSAATAPAREVASEPIEVDLGEADSAGGAAPDTAAPAPADTAPAAADTTAPGLEPVL